MKDRIRAILARVEAAAETARKSKQGADTKAAAASQIGAKVENAWVSLRGHLEEYVRATNSRLPNHVKVSVKRSSSHRDRSLVDLLELRMPTGINCIVQVERNGDIAVRMGTTRYKLYAL